MNKIKAGDAVTLHLEIKTDSTFEQVLDEARAQIERIFANMESEDERIRGNIVALVEQSTEILSPRNKQGMLSWLEKQKEQKWSPSEGEMGVLYKLCYISNQITDEDDTELTRLYQDLKREYFNGHSFENMFLNKKQKEQKPAEYDDKNPMEIKFAGKIYRVHGVRALPGGLEGYIIEDEPGHYDCITNPDEVLGGGYGIKSSGSPYPTGTSMFDKPVEWG